MDPEALLRGRTDECLGVAELVVSALLEDLEEGRGRETVKILL